VQRSRPVCENLFCTFSNAVPRGTSKLRSSELKFSTSGFPGYGFKRRLHPESASASRGSKAPAYPPPLPRVGSDLRVSLQGRSPRAEALATTASTMNRPPVLSSPRVMWSPRSSVLRPDLPGLAPLPDLTGYAYTASPASRGCSRRAPSPSLLCQDILDTMPPPITTRCTFPSLPRCCQSSPFGTGLDSFFVPDSPISRGTFSTRQSSLYATAWCLASPRVIPRLTATGTLSSRLSPGESPPPDARLATWPNGKLPRSD